MIYSIYITLQAPYLDDDADDDSVLRSLEAYLLWLFGYIMFNNGHGNAVDKILIPYAQEIVDSEEDAVPTWSWGSAVLAATYRGLCEACVKDEPTAILQGCPLLLQLWAYKRKAVGRPMIDHSPYEPDFYGTFEDDRPTMGTLWLSTQQVHNGYFNLVRS